MIKLLLFQNTLYIIGQDKKFENLIVEVKNKSGVVIEEKEFDLRKKVDYIEMGEEAIKLTSAAERETVKGGSRGIGLGEGR